MAFNLQPLFADPYGTPALVRRLITEHGLVYWRRYFLAFVLMGTAAACTAFSAYLFGDIVNQAYVHRNFPAIITLCAVIIAIFTIKGFATYGQAVVLARIANRIVAHNQRRMFDKLLTESLGYLARRHSSEYMARLAAGATAASQVLNLLIMAVGRDFLTLIGLIVVMVLEEPVMTLIGLLVGPPSILVMRKLIRRARGIAYNQFTGGARILETLQEAIQGMRIVKAFTLERTMQARMEESIADVERASNKMARVANRASPLMETLGGIAVALAVLYGGYRVIETGAAPGGFVSFMAAFLLAYEPAKRLARLNIDLAGALVGVRVLFELFDSPSTEPREDGKPPLKLSAARVEFRDVEFAYRTDEPVIRHMSFVAEPGRVTALVGPSGGGKTTALNLILRFDEVERGAILIDGQDIAQVSRQSLRKQIAYVGQDVFLFRGSVRDNIAFGSPDATEADIIAAAQAAHAHEFIMSFPTGYETPVGEHGMQLSGGQRQRVAVARALVKNAPLILLDEATASLDSESERLVQDAIKHLCQDRTTIVVAHRLHTIMHADKILVVEAGEIVETGRHEDLLRKGGRYASFFRLQLTGQTPQHDAVPLASLA
jgi:ATP-binding cassette subfamily B protein